jgi:hypothetical protein
VRTTQDDLRLCGVRRPQQDVLGAQDGVLPEGCALAWLRNCWAAAAMPRVLAAMLQRVHMLDSRLLAPLEGCARSVGMTQLRRRRRAVALCMGVLRFSHAACLRQRPRCEEPHGPCSLQPRSVGRRQPNAAMPAGTDTCDMYARSLQGPGASQHVRTLTFVHHILRSATALPPALTARSAGHTGPKTPIRTHS